MDLEQNLIIKIAWYYYMEGMTQKQISDKLNISRMKIVKYLETARSHGIVKFSVRANGEKKMNLERQLMDKYGLNDTYVVPTTEYNLNKTIAKAAAQYIEGKLTPNSYINVGYGETVSHAIRYLTSFLEVPVSFVSLSGGVTFYASSMAGMRNFDNSMDLPKFFIVPSPLIVSSQGLAEQLLQERSVKEILDMTELSDYTVIGVGAPDRTATIMKTNQISENDLILLKMNGAIGDILSQFYDKDGNKINSDLHQRLITVQLEKLKEKKNVIAVAGGPSKIESINAALKAGYIDIMITDECTAESLLTL
ncbi:MAG: sugar-binding transcriptional regulator [Tissierellaceae bacterium]|nr:sugar-binding transcriptional regulator [Tissierellaceae bacterium]